MNLDSTGKAVKIQHIRINNMLYADNIGIIVAREMGMTVLLIMLVQQIQRLEL